ncbi:carbohydrate-binding protein [Acidovorax sp. SUPP2522]|uniref:hypothetical protein n=1 Tax=unclassified Acidovorax TaxID=2684926 RepID=UPI00234AC7AA|nr:MULTISPECIES: hypothetical protein [unclassified Acidovorax]WCM99987.1 hypothetical protein M5C96_11630 [Acidovorax sp. GBBC 1281]GKT18547.1 carbohydrate-binding protein [Acidovorax sp. SUPP2522]
MSDNYTRGMGFIAPLAITLANMTINVPASTLPAWAAGTSYASGVSVIDAATRIIYLSLKDANVGNVPATSSTAWQPRGVEERMRMCDASLGSYIERDDLIEAVITPQRVVTDLAIFGAVSQSVQVVMVDPTEGEVFNVEVNMLRPSGNSHWGYFFAPIERENRVLISGLPAYARATITVRIKNPGLKARCGELVIGRAVWLGNTQWRPSIAFDDFTEKKRDVWGGWQVGTQGNYSDRLKLQVLVESAAYERTRSAVIPFRSKPVVWIGARGYSALMAYGYLTAFEQVLVSHGRSDCSMTVDGLETL